MTQQGIGIRPQAGRPEGIKRKRQQGVGLIEILVALMITAVGLIGISGMQAVSLKNNMSALNRSNALFLAGSIMDRIRANPTGDYVIAFADDPPANMTTCTTAGSSCSTDQIADLHLTLWRCMLGGYQAHIACAGTEPVMPDAQGQIALVGGNYVIEIRYVDRVSYNNGVQETSGQPVTLRTTLGL